MPSKKEYDLVSDDGHDTHIPLHNEDAFQHGIQFQAKYIGTLDVPRPSSRVEIVAAMRRIRYEFKVKGIKKKKVNLIVSVDGVRVSICKKKKKLPQWYDENKLVIVQHPIYRIFYVSHDSQDLKIWSYIARDGPSNMFKCNVFKSYKKEQAMRIVRTIGQAFEVCHKLSATHPTVSVPEETAWTGSNHSLNVDEQRTKNKSKEDRTPTENEGSITTSKGNTNLPNELVLRQAQQLLYQIATTSPQQVERKLITAPIISQSSVDEDNLDTKLPVSSIHQMHLLRQQVEQQQHVAVAQVQLLKEQLAAETAARIESQARTHQLLVQNHDLLDHMKQLLSRLQKLELHSNSIQHKATQNMITQGSPIPDATTPLCSPMYMSRGLITGNDNCNVCSPNLPMIEDIKPLSDTDSPDSGHREMSSDSLTLMLQPEEIPFWTASMLHDDRKKYSFGFSSPVKFKQLSYEMTAIVNSNLFANNKDSICDRDILDFTLLEDKGRVLEIDSDGSNLQAHPKLRPPPEFCNYDSLRNSQISEDSSNSSDTYSAKDGIVTFTDKDFYTHTGSITNTHGIEQSRAQFIDNRELKSCDIIFRPKLDYLYNNFESSKANEQSRGQKYFDNNLQWQKGSFSDEDNTESYDEHLTKHPSPPNMSQEEHEK